MVPASARRVGARVFSIAALVLVLMAFWGGAAAKAGEAAESGSVAGQAAPAIVIPRETQKVVAGEAHEIFDYTQLQVRGLFARRPLGFDADAFGEVRGWLLDFPRQVSILYGEIVAQGRILGVAGSSAILLFLCVLFYTFMGRKRVLESLESAVAPMRERLSARRYLLFLSVLRIVAAPALPLLLYGLFLFLGALTNYGAPWFLLIGRFLLLWALGVFVANGLREALLSAHSTVPVEHARSLYGGARVIILYSLFNMTIFLVAEALGAPRDILALLGTALSIFIAVALFLFLLKKHAIMGLFPELPYAPYRVFHACLERFYRPAVFLTFLTGLLWIFGYRKLVQFLWIRTWGAAGAFLLFVLVYHVIERSLRERIPVKDGVGKPAEALYASAHTLLLFVAATSCAASLLSLLGLLYPLRVFFSFPLLMVGDATLSLWALARAVLVFVIFMLLSRLLRAYLDYRVYPRLGVGEGLAYSLNTLFGYLILGLAILSSMHALGFDIKLFLVFGGALGVGVGFGLQHFVSNLIGGLILIFGGKVRKSDWIQAGEKLGYVEEVGIGSTKLKTADNIEYVIPNSELVAKTVVNYTLSDPQIRIHIPVAAPYGAKVPELVKILRTVAEENENVVRSRKPKVWFVEYGETSLKFELLVWIDIRRSGEKEVRSQLYFAIYDALPKAGMELVPPGEPRNA
jgi:small-conductance mechanosensitive channel